MQYKNCPECGSKKICLNEPTEIQRTFEELSKQTVMDCYCANCGLHFWYLPRAGIIGDFAEVETTSKKKKK